MMVSVFLALLFQTADTIPTSPFNGQTFLETVRIVHHPPEIMFERRPYDLACYVDFPEDSILSVTLFLKTDKSSFYQEIDLSRFYDMYSYRWLDNELKYSTVEYFFLVETTGTIFATPLDSSGSIQPVKRTILNPVEYYRRRK